MRSANRGIVGFKLQSQQTTTTKATTIRSKTTTKIKNNDGNGC